LVASERSKLHSSVSFDGSDTDKARQALSELSCPIIDSLVEWESRRLQRDLERRIRSYEIIERSNSEQLLKEEKSRVLQRKRAERCERASMLQSLKSEDVRASRTAKERLHCQIARRLEQDLDQKRAAIVEHLADEHQRLGYLLAQRNRSQNERKARWNNKLDKLRRRAVFLRKEQAIKNADSMERFESKVHVFERKKAESIKEMLLKHEDVTIRLLDASERRDRIQRMDNERKSRIATQLDNDVARVSCMLATKDAISKQRHDIIREHAFDGSKPINIKDFSPGPADYSQLASSVKEHYVPKLSAAKPKLMMPGAFDFEIPDRSRHSPPVVFYETSVLRQGDHTWGDSKVSIGKSAKRTYFDEVLQLNQAIPGPGSYFKDGVPSGFECMHPQKLTRTYYCKRSSTARNTLYDRV